MVSTRGGKGWITRFVFLLFLFFKCLYSPVYWDNSYKMAVPNSYIDLNDTIYSFATSSPATPAGSSDEIYFGLADIGEAPATQSWFINKVVCRYTGYSDTAGPATDTILQFNSGVIMRDLAGVEEFSELSDFQDFRAWPFKGAIRSIMIQNIVQHNQTSYTFTYSPRKTLVLNREQNIIFSLKNVSGNAMQGRFNLYIQGKRGSE